MMEFVAACLRILSLYAYHCAHVLSIRTYNPILVCEFLLRAIYLPWIRCYNQNQKQKKQIAHPPVIETERWIGIESWRHGFLLISSGKTLKRKTNYMPWDAKLFSRDYERASIRKWHCHRVTPRLILFFDFDKQICSKKRSKRLWHMFYHQCVCATCNKCEQQSFLGIEI